MESQERCDGENRMFQAAIRPRAFELLLPAFIGLLALLLPARAHAQSLYYLQNGGRPTFNTPAPVEKGFIDLANGDLHLEIPLASPAQRGSMTTNARMVYDGRIWVIVDNGTSKSWQPTNLPDFMTGGWNWVYSDDDLGTGEFQDLEYCGGSSYTAYYGPFATISFDGTAKFFPINTQHDFGCGNPNIATGSAYDQHSTGSHMSVSNYTTIAASDHSGTSITTWKIATATTSPSMGAGFSLTL